VHPPATAPPEQPAPEVQAPPVEAETAPPIAPEPAKPSPMPLPARPTAPREVPKPQRVRDVAVATLPANPVPVAPSAPLPPPPLSPTIAPPPVATEPEHETPASPEVTAAVAPQPHQVTLNAGLLLPVRLVDGLSSERNVPGDAFAATLDKELVADGFVIAERGARVEGRVVAVDRAKLRSAALAVELISLHTSDGQTITIATENYFKHANAGQVDSTAKLAGGGTLGALVGGKSAGIGGGAGAGDAMLTRGKSAELPSEMLVTFKLKDDVPLTERLR